MRGKRSKQYKKLMQQYGLVFGFREPYQVLIDAQMIQDADRFTMDLLGGLERVLHGKVKPMITQCSIRHLYTLTSISQPQKEAMILRAKAMERRRCNHHQLDHPLSTLECLSSVIDPKKSRTNKNRYVVASQDEEVRKYCRGIKGVPLVYVKRSVMVMEPMAESSLGAREGFERGKFRVGIRGKGNNPGQKRKRDEFESCGNEDENEQQPNPADEGAGLDTVPVKKKRARGLKGPNPLSIKKSQKDKPTEFSNAAEQGTQNKDRQPTPNIIELVDEEGGQALKRKRKRKHKSRLAELLQADAMAEDLN